MVNEDASTNPIIRAENFKDLLEIVNAFEELNDNTRFGKVITPNMLNESTEEAAWATRGEWRPSPFPATDTPNRCS